MIIIIIFIFQKKKPLAMTTSSTTLTDFAFYDWHHRKKKKITTKLFGLQEGGKRFGIVANLDHTGQEAIGTAVHVEVVRRFLFKIVTFTFTPFSCLTGEC